MIFPVKATANETTHKFTFSFVPCKTNMENHILLRSIEIKWKSVKYTVF